ncbi:MAG: hypothetical protein DRG83_13300 [Deltaproteobacteria bacterium]|nr:MAG: hypothetical protein DRG83_13300 [Deltaproteobacteria bacterium]
MSTSRIFYEGKFISTRYANRRPPFRKHKKWLFDRYFTGGGRALDIGCGGGNELFCRADKVIGVDLSFSSLQNAKKIYDAAVLADVENLPFKDACFDWIVSEDVLGHIPFENKAKVLRELDRILKPGGKHVHYIETVGHNRLQRFAQSDPVLYRKYFVEKDGHFGLESPQEVIQRFHDMGYSPLVEVGLYKTFIRELNEHLKRFDNAYQTRSYVLSLSVTVVKKVSKFPKLSYRLSKLIDWYIRITDHILPLHMADGLFVCYEKPFNE